jgi:glutamate N-acetyltransferase/amino-acid N-acetyltransferase
VIGVPLPMKRVRRGIEAACRALSRGEAADQNAARAIMTTDTVPKTAAVRVQLQSGSVIIGGMAKGAGMIHPNMATMLSFVTTDAAIAPELLQRLLKDTADDSYHMISVDGDTSTNDAVMVLANGCADAPMLCEGSADFEAFREAFHHVHQTLARAIAWDGEGATKRLQVEVTGAASKVDARCLARTVAASNLVKTALFGADANWGRVLAAMGRAGAAFDPDRVHLTFASRAGSVCVLRDSVPQSFDENAARKILEDDVVRIVVELQEGEGQATAWGCDLSYEYVRINGEYRT